MKIIVIKYLVILVVFLGWLCFPSCKHEPILDTNITPVDTSGTIDTMPMDTMPMDTMPIDTTVTGIPCDSNTVYFNMDILPILQSNCAISACHDDITQEDGVILESYQDLIETTDITPFNLNESDLYEVLIDNDPDKRMPPPPANPLSIDQINTITRWILQGAENLTCDPDFEGCETENISYAEFIEPLLLNNCVGCHSGSPPSGGIDLTTHENVATYALNGRLYGAIAHESGFSPMPQGADPLDSCFVDKIKSWIDEGAPNN